MHNSSQQSLLSDLRFHIDAGNLSLRAQQLRARWKMYPMMVAGQMLLELLFVALFWSQSSHESLLSWLGVMFALHSMEVMGWRRYKNQFESVDQCRLWNRRYIHYSIAIGLAWGSVALLFYPQDMAYQTLLICVVLGLAAGAVTMNAVHPPTLYIFVLLSSLPLFLSLLVVSKDVTHWILAGMLMLFLVMVLNAGRELSKTFWTSLVRRFENDSLIRQLTEQKMLAEAASRDKSRFLAAASHDLRQPLQALVLFSEALQDIAVEKNTVHLAGQIGKSVGALVDMFDELLDISRLDAGVVEVRWQHFQIRDIYDRLYVDYAPLAHAKGLLFELPTCRQVVYSDPYLLERMLRNLISNAVRYTSSGGVRVDCECLESTLQLKVVDSGIGMTEESTRHIFDEYFQVANPQRDRSLGLGLGLSIVKRIESLLGCKLEVTSVPGKGSVFAFSVTLGDAAQISQAFVANTASHDLSGVTVALVEDDREIRQTVSELMMQWGCRVTAGALPDEVMGTMEAHNLRPDILVCDYRLPQGLTALHVLKLARGIWGAEIPALVLTGDTEPQTLLEIQGSGALLLHKPIRPARLRAIMYFALHGES